MKRKVLRSPIGFGWMRLGVNYMLFYNQNQPVKVLSFERINRNSKFRYQNGKQNEEWIIYCDVIEWYTSASEQISDIITSHSDQFNWRINIIKNSVKRNLYYTVSILKRSGIRICIMTVSFRLAELSTNCPSDQT